jgi:hypothetical protein
MSVTALFPSEIWLKIFNDACIDGGSIGCSLVEVSRYFRDLVDPIRFDSVLIDGLRRLGCFIHQLQRGLPPNSGVRRLSLMDSARDDNSLRADYNLRKREWGIGYQNLIQLISPTIEVLTILVEFPFNMGGLDNISHCGEELPALRDLTLRGEHASGLLGRPSTTMPSLRRVHIFHHQPGHGSQLIKQLAHCAPSLTQLRLSNLFHDLDLPLALGALLSRPGYLAPWSWGLARSSTLPDTLQSISVQVVQTEGDDARQRAMIRGLFELVASNGVAGAQVNFMPCVESDGTSLKDEWLDLVNGGHGGWPGQ